MISSKQIQLKSKSILNVPLQQYDDFYFIVNGKEFKSTRIIADLLSPKICQNHQFDPTIDSFAINTANEGDFSTILKLVYFEKQEIQENEFFFIQEVLDILQNDFIVVNSPDIKITNENVFNLLQNHLKFKEFNSESILEEIGYIASNFSEIVERYEEQVIQLDVDILEGVITNNNFVLRDEDQLLTFINKLYMQDAKFAWLYQYVIFENVADETIEEFLSIYDINDINTAVWKAISNRLKQHVIKNDEKKRTHIFRYKQISTNILSNFNKNFMIFRQIFYDISTNVLSNFNKCFIKFQQIFYDISTDILYNFNKCFITFQQISYYISTNIISNFNKYFIEFRQIFYDISINILSNFNKYFI